MAWGRKDFLRRSVLHRGGMSLLLKVLLCEFSTWLRGWMLLSRILCSLHSILLSDTTTKESSWTPRTEPAFLMILLILLASAVLSLLPQHTEKKKKNVVFTVKTIWFFLLGFCSFLFYLMDPRPTSKLDKIQNRNWKNKVQKKAKFKTKWEIGNQNIIPKGKHEEWPRGGTRNRQTDRVTGNITGDIRKRTDKDQMEDKDRHTNDKMRNRWGEWRGDNDRWGNKDKYRGENSLWGEHKGDTNGHRFKIKKKT